MLKEEIVKSCSGVSMTIGKQAFLFFSGKLLSRRPDDRQGGVEGKERNQSCLVKRFDGNSSVGKSKGSRIDDGRKLFLICVSRVAVSVVKRIPSRLLFFFFFFLEERSSVCRHSANRFYAVILSGLICWEFFSNLSLVPSIEH